MNRQLFFDHSAKTRAAFKPPDENLIVVDRNYINELKTAQHKS